MRKDFPLTPEHEDYFQDQGFHLETLIENGNWVIIRNFPIPAGYNVSNADVAIQLHAGYPLSALDMAYFYPALSRMDGIAIPAIEPMVIEGKTYQRWSRHRDTPSLNNEDNLIIHVEEIKYWFINEFIKRPNQYEAA